MNDLSNHFIETLKELEKLKQKIMININEMGANDQAVKRTTVYPMARVKPLIINDYPVFQFSYEGMLPHNKRDDLEYLSMVRHYYYRATFDAYDYTQLKKPVFYEAVIIFVEYFKDHIVRDLDNLSKKYVQDAIKLTRIIRDDNWKTVWNVDIGFLDGEKNHVQVYVVSRENMIDFLDYLSNNHQYLKNINEEKQLDRRYYEQEYFRKKKKERRNNKKNQQNKKKEPEKNKDKENKENYW